jgi:hypothetical protein
MKIIHIGPDDQFIQFIADVFEEVAPGVNHYLITELLSKELRHLTLQTDDFTVIGSGKKGLLSIPKHVKSCDMIIVHGMGIHGIVAFLASPRKTLRVWSGWGFDYYGNNIDSKMGLLSQSTKNLISEKKSDRVKISFLKFIKRALFKQAVMIATKKTDYFSAPIPTDFSIFKRRFDTFRGEYSQLNYGSVSDTFSHGYLEQDGINILVGNSAAPTNNHIDIFKLLSKCNLGSRKVIVPLSYGDPNYRERILICGRELLGDSFFPLINYMPLEKYNNIIASCNVVIMNHYRQQALGNICTALYQGLHVYLNIKSPAYSFFNKIGAVMHDIQHLNLKSLPLTRVPDEDIAKNREALEGFWGRNQVKANVENLLAKVRRR